METFEKQKFIKKKDYGRAFEMTANEKTTSFLNNYFVFKKIRNINSEQVSMVMAGETEEEKATQEAQGDKLTKIAKQDKPKGKKKKELVTVITPSGEKNFEISEVKYI